MAVRDVESDANEVIVARRARFVAAALAGLAVDGSCDPPYTVDASGIKHYKAECL